MGVAVLPPQDFLRNHHHVMSHKPRRNPNPNPNRSSRRRRNTSPTPTPSPPSLSPPRSKTPPAIGQIRILKRGENLSPNNPNPNPKNPSPSRRSVRDEPVQVPVRSKSEPGLVLDGFYAGSAFVTSPPPSDLPLPAFFTKRNCGLSEAHNQEIACELRRVLKLI